MDTSFLNLARGNRLNRDMGLVMEESNIYMFGNDYTYIEIPVLAALSSDGDMVQKVSRNQYVRIIPACSIKPTARAKVLVEPNPDLAQWGLFQPSYYVHGDGESLVPGFMFQARKDLSLSDLDYAIRLYLRA